MTGLLRIGDWEFDPTSGELRRGADWARLGPKTAEVLLALAARPGELLSKEDLLAAVWGERIVGDEVLAHALWEIRKALGDDARQPEYVETIPKRGYRLIATAGPVIGDRSQEPDPEAPAPRRGGRILWVAPVALALAAAGLWWMLRPEDPRPRLWVDTAEAAGGPTATQLATGLEAALLDELAGLPGIEIVRGPARRGGAGLRLVPTLLAGDDGHQVRIRVEENAREALLFTTGAVPLGGPEELATVTARLAGEIGAYLRVREMPLAADPDVRPWFSLRRHRIEAIEKFLFGAEFVYRYEVGSERYFEQASKLDPDFVAPFVWRAGSVRSSGDPDRIASLRGEYERLWGAASPFEQASIGWAMAMLDRDLGRQKRHLELALDKAPENNILTLNLAVVEQAMGNLPKALALFEDLIDSGWDYPWLQPGAAELCLRLQGVERGRKILEAGLRHAKAPPETFALAELLYRYLDDEQRAGAMRRRLEARVAEMSPEVVELDFAELAELLAAMAEVEGRERVAAALRKTVF